MMPRITSPLPTPHKHLLTHTYRAAFSTVFEMGVHQLLPMLIAFMGTMLFYAAYALAIMLPAPSVAAAFVSKHPIDVNLLSPGLSPSVDFFGIDGSVLIHVCLRRCMTDVVVNGDFTSFSSEMRSILTRLQLQTSKYGGHDKSRTQQLFIVFDGYRIAGKLVNVSRAAARASALQKITTHCCRLLNQLNWKKRI